MVTAAEADAATGNYTRRLVDIRNAAKRTVAFQFAQLPKLNDSNVRDFERAAAPILAGAERATAALTTGYMNLLTGAKLSTPASLGIETDFRHPFIGTWTDLSRGVPFDQARRRGIQRAGNLGQERTILIERAVMTGADRDGVTVGPHGRKMVWVRKPIGTTCAWCTAVAGQHYRTAESASFGHGHNGVDYCVVGDVRVSSGSARSVLRMRYSGQIVILRTAGGNELTVTPNHPILTPTGWVPAGELSEGMDVISGRGNDGASLSSGIPYEHDVPASIEKRFRAASVSAPRSVFPDVVPILSENFHGDRVHGKVDVVPAYRHFGNGRFAQFAQPFEQIGLPAGWAPASDLTGPCPFHQRILGLAHPADRGVSGLGLGGPFGLGHSGSPFDAGVASASRLYAGVQQMAPDYVPRYSESYSEGVFGFAGDVPLKQSGRTRDYVAADFDAATGKLGPDRLGVDAESARRLLDTVAGKVQADRVVFHRLVDSSDIHVYDIHTAEGYYAANGILVHNCDCLVVPVEQYGEADAKIGAHYRQMRRFEASHGTKVRTWNADTDEPVEVRKSAGRVEKWNRVVDPNHVMTDDDLDVIQRTADRISTDYRLGEGEIYVYDGQIPRVSNAIAEAHDRNGGQNGIRIDGAEWRREFDDPHSPFYRPQVMLTHNVGPDREGIIVHEFGYRIQHRTEKAVRRITNFDERVQAESDLSRLTNPRSFFPDVITPDETLVSSYAATNGHENGAEMFSTYFYGGRIATPRWVPPKSDDRVNFLYQEVADRQDRLDEIRIQRVNDYMAFVHRVLGLPPPRVLGPGRAPAYSDPEAS